MLKTLKLVTILLIFIPYRLIAEETHTSIDQAFQLADAQGIKNSPTWVKIWLLVANLSFFSSLWFVKNLKAPRWLAAGFAGSVISQIFLSTIVGVTPVYGMFATTHILFWSPGYIKLIKEKAYKHPKSRYAMWSSWMIAVISFSFIFDLRNSIIYIEQILKF